MPLLDFRVSEVTPFSRSPNVMLHLEPLSGNTGKPLDLCTMWSILVLPAKPGEYKPGQILQVTVEPRSE